MKSICEQYIWLHSVTYLSIFRKYSDAIILHATTIIQYVLCKIGMRERRVQLSNRDLGKAGTQNFGSWGEGTGRSKPFPKVSG